MNIKSFYASIVGNALSITSVSLSAQESEAVVSIICMIVGLLITIVSGIIIPLYKWYKKAKEDGKITSEEIDEAVKIIEDGTDKIKNQTEKKGDKHE